jgi:hypothetical protein
MIPNYKYVGILVTDQNYDLDHEEFRGYPLETKHHNCPYIIVSFGNKTPRNCM